MSRSSAATACGSCRSPPQPRAAWSRPSLSMTRWIQPLRSRTVPVLLRPSPTSTLHPLPNMPRRRQRPSCSPLPQRSPHPGRLLPRVHRLLGASRLPPNMMCGPFLALVGGNAPRDLPLLLAAQNSLRHGVFGRSPSLPCLRCSTFQKSVGENALGGLPSLPATSFARGRQCPPPDLLLHARSLFRLQLSQRSPMLLPPTQTTRSPMQPSPNTKPHPSRPHHFHLRLPPLSRRLN